MQSYRSINAPASHIRTLTVLVVLLVLLLLLGVAIIAVTSVTLGKLAVDEVEDEVEEVEEVVTCGSDMVATANQYLAIFQSQDLDDILDLFSTDPTVTVNCDGLPTSGTWTGLDSSDDSSIVALYAIYSTLAFDVTIASPSILAVNCEARTVVIQYSTTATYRCQNILRVTSGVIADQSSVAILEFDVSGFIQNIIITDSCDATTNFYQGVCATLKVANVVQLGVGSSGSILATRINTALPHLTYYALEHGLNKNDDPMVTEVQNFLVPYQDPIYTQAFLGTPDPNANFQRTVYTVGDMLGGSGNHDFMLEVWPSAYYCNKTLVDAGGSGFDWPTIRRFLKNSETVTSFDFTPDANRGTDGLMSTFIFREELFNSTSDQMLLKIPSAFTADASVQLTNDTNLGQDTSITFYTQTWWRLNGYDPTLRSSPGIDYIGKIINTDGTGKSGHENLFVEFGAQADKLLVEVVDGEKHAYGVQYTDINGNEQIIYALNEIIISLGALLTPGLLERSGVGDQDRLTDLGITPLINNPLVGEGMLNHPGSLFVFNTNTTWDSFALASWYAHLSVLPEMNGHRLMQVFASAAFVPLLPAAIRQLLDIPPPGMTAVAIIAFNMQPLSQGSVHIVSKQPSKEPRPVENAFTDATDRDMRSFYETMRSLKALVQLQATSDPSHSYEVVYPTSAAFADATNATLRQQIIDAYIPGAHWSSTARMSPSSATGVVDQNFAVRGFSGPVNVRVVDNSVAPSIQSGCPTCSGISPGNVRAQAVFYAEKAAADVIIPALSA